MLAYWDANKRCRFANRAYEKWFGVKAETMVGRDMKEFLGPLRGVQRMQRQLQVAERLAAMATLAGGIAHEINNPLAVVLANIEFASRFAENENHALLDAHQASASRRSRRSIRHHRVA